MTIRDIAPAQASAALRRLAAQIERGEWVPQSLELREVAKTGTYAMWVLSLETKKARSA